MKHLLSNAVWSFFILTGGNFFHQFMSSTPDWGTAVERSFSQLLAIVLFAWLMAPRMPQLNE